MNTQTFQYSESYEQALERAARLWGIEPGYADTWGAWHQTSADTNRGILRALGVATGSREEIDAAMEERMWREWSSILPSVLVLGEGQRSLPLHVPAAQAGAAADLEIHWEDGRTERRVLALGELGETERAELRGQQFVLKHAPLSEGAPLGYHECTVTLAEGDRRSATTRLILCPDRVYVPPAIRDGRKAAGLAIALYGLRSRRNWGCGDFTDLEELADWLARDVGVAFIGLNPLHAIPNRQPFNISPYLPSSAFFKNPIYLDVERIEDFQKSASARAFFAKPEIQSELEALRNSQFVEYERVYALKVKALRFAYQTFLREYNRGSERADQFRAYLDREGDLLDRYSTWCALDEWIHGRQPSVWIWPDWDEQWRDPDSKAVRAFTRKHWRAVLFHKYVQWQTDLQLEAAQARARERGLAIGLYHDLALATDRCGADLWAHRPFYVSGCRVGAPPDGFSPKGQDWSFPPPNSVRHRENGYRLFAETIRANCRHGGALRIDHVMRFFRLYWIPENMDPTAGAYVRDRNDELLRILALESVRQQVTIVGEDLGTVTPEIRGALDHFGLYGYKVLYFEKSWDGGFRLPGDYPQQALVCSTTHDLPTLAGFWVGRDIQRRQEAGLLHDDEACRQQWEERAREKQKLLDALFTSGLMPDWISRDATQTRELTPELHDALIGMLALTPSALLALNQEDMTGEPEQQNLPSTTTEHPNWRRKMRFSLEELRSDATARNLAGMLRGWLERTGRLSSEAVPR
jgi:4-alpha-glucanotransferase